MPGSSLTSHRQIIYRSVPRTAWRTDSVEILRQARVNNGLNGITGFLWSDADVYVQVLEGTPEAMTHVFDMINSDARHSDVIVVSDRTVSARNFGHWAMASLSFDWDDQPLLDRLRQVIATLPASAVPLFDRIIHPHG